MSKLKKYQLVWSGMASRNWEIFFEKIIALNKLTQAFQACQAFPANFTPMLLQPLKPSRIRMEGSAIFYKITRMNSRSQMQRKSVVHSSNFYKYNRPPSDLQSD